MNTKKTNRLIAGAVFLFSFIQFTLTVQPSVPFWDCGEYAAAAAGLQINHPPGVPMFLLVARLFQMIPFGDPGWRTNMLSVVASAVAVMVCYLIIVEAIKLWRKKTEGKTDMLLVHGAAIVGALAFSFSGSFWFSAVETELYCPGTMLITIILWLGLQWNKHAEEPGSERYLLLILYLLGVATAVYMFATLPFFMVVLLVYFRKYPLNRKSFALMCGAAVLMFVVIYPGIVIYFPTLLGGNIPYFRTLDENGVSVPAIQESPALTILAILIVAAAGYFFWWTRKEKKNALWSMLAFGFLSILLGYMSFTVVLLRSNAHPPLNENAPDNLTRFTSYIAREQYGNAPLAFPRRYSNDPLHRPTWQNYTSDGQFFWKYQMEHMFLRYMYWNYIGRAGDVQDAPAGFTLAVIPDAAKKLEQWWYGYWNPGVFPIRFFGIPFLLGLFGAYWHFKKDWKTGLVFLAGFLAMGVVAAFVQNQQDPQPRERDYFYSGACFMYSMWIGIGALGILELVEEKLGKRPQGWFGPAVGTFAVIAIAVDFNMAYNGWKVNDRSYNYIPWDYSYNILQSCEKDAILFTNGDNDTFPLWYLQNVAGIRRDVRIVNLSLGQTHWYVNQLKNEEPYSTPKVPISIPDAALEKNEDDPTGFYPQPGNPHVVAIPVPRDTMFAYTHDSALPANPVIRFTYTPSSTYTINGKPTKFFNTADQLIYDIVKTNAERGWTRPIYWAITCTPDAYVGLYNYTRTEGLAQKLVPIQSQTRTGIDAMDATAMEANLMHEPDRGYTTPHYGFRFRDLDNPHLYMDEVHRRLLATYRQAFMTLAAYDIYGAKPDYAAADSALNRMNEKISPEYWPMQYELLYQTATFYYAIGDSANFRKYSASTIQACKDMQDIPGYAMYGDQRFPPYQLMLDMYDKRGDYDVAIDLLNSLMPRVEGNQSQIKLIREKISELQIKKYEQEGKYTQAIAEVQNALAGLGNATDQNTLLTRQNFEQLLMQLKQKAGIKDSALADSAK